MLVRAVVAQKRREVDFGGRISPRLVDQITVLFVEWEPGRVHGAV